MKFIRYPQGTRFLPHKGAVPMIGENRQLVTNEPVEFEK